MQLGSQFVCIVCNGTMWVWQSTALILVMWNLCGYFVFRSAAENAGFKVLRFIRESAASMLAYDLGQKHHHELVYVLCQLLRLHNIAWDANKRSSHMELCMPVKRACNSAYIGIILCWWALCRHRSLFALPWYWLLIISRFNNSNHKSMAVYCCLTRAMP